MFTPSLPARRGGYPAAGRTAKRSRATGNLHPAGDAIRASGADIKKRNLDEVALKTTPMEEGGGDISRTTE
jgi:hypothetical protein